MEPDADKKNRTAFSIFIDGALTTIYNEASGRSKDQKYLRTGLKSVLGEYNRPHGLHSEECDTIGRSDSGTAARHFATKSVYAPLACVRRRDH